MGCGSSNAKGHVAPSSAEETAKNNEIAERIKKRKEAASAAVKVLLLGAGECGKSTILKQMKIINLKDEPTDQEKNDAKKLVWKNTLDSIQAIAAACKPTALNIPYENPGSDEIAAKILAVDSSSDIPLDIAEDIKKLWEDPACKKAKKRENEFHLLDSAVYFLDKVVDYFKPDFEASVQDQLRSRLTTTGIIETSFEIDKTNIKMFDVGGQRGERKKWIHCFDDVTAIMFIAALSEYNQVLAEDRTRNRLDESLDLFGGIANLPWFDKAAVILFLNKKDLFEEKVIKIDIGDFHPEYTGGLDYHKGLAFITEEYLDRNENESKEVYCHATDATNTENVSFVWGSVKNTILENKLSESGLQM